MKKFNKKVSLFLASTLVLQYPVAAAEPVTYLVGQVERGDERQRVQGVGEQAEYLSTQSKFEDLKKNALVFLELTGEDRLFDGTKVLDVKERITNLEQLSNLESGSVIIRYKPIGQTGANTTLLAMGSDSSHYGALLHPNSNQTDKRLRFDFSGYRFNEKNARYLENEWNTVIYSVDKQNATESVVAAYNGEGSAYAATADRFLDQVTFGPSSFFNIGGHTGNLQYSGAPQNFKGEIDYVLITNEVLDLKTAKELTAPKDKNNMATLFNDAPDNTWVFTGSREIAAHPEDIGTARSFIGHFEEYIRWSIGSATVNKRQRYVMNTAKNGKSVAEIDEQFEETIKQYKPKAVAIMIDQKDFQTEVGAFKTSLQSIVDKVYAMDAKPLFITPVQSRDAAQNLKIEPLIQAMREVSEANEGIKMINLYTAMDADRYVNANDTVNAAGHLEIANQVLGELLGASFSPNGFGKEVVAEKVIKVNEAPQVEVDGTSQQMTVTMPKILGITGEVIYELTIDQTTIRETVGESTFTLTNLPVNKEFSLTTYVRVAEEKIYQLSTVTGNTQTGESMVQPETVQPTTPESIASLWNQSQPLNWLFIGDSITHGAAHTYGYDSVPQLWEKFLIEEGRGQDVVINTAVSSANAGTGAEGVLNPAYKPYRLDRYLDTSAEGVKADVVMIMLGTNDCVVSGMTPELFKTNIETIVSQVKAAGAIPILRTPNPINASKGTRAVQLPKYAEKIREVAAEQEVILVDHFAEWSALQADKMPHLVNNVAYKSWLNDGLHPNPNGQLNMAQAIIQALGKYNPESIVANNAYQINLPVTQSAVDVTPYLTATQTGFELDLDGLVQGAGYNLDRIQMRVVDHMSGKEKQFEAQTATLVGQLTLLGLEPGSLYEIEVSGSYKQGNDAGIPIAFPKITMETASSNAQGTIQLTPELTQPPFNVGDVYGILSATYEDVVQEQVTYELVAASGEGAQHNGFFEIEGNQLKIAKPIEQGKRYNICVEATTQQTRFKQNIIIETGKEEGLVYVDKDIVINEVSQAKALTPQQVEELKNTDDMTIVVQFKQNNSGYGSLFSLSNPKNANAHFHVAVKGDVIAMEFRGAPGGDINNKVNGSYESVIKTGEVNTIAFKAVKDEGFKIFANGKLVNTIPLDSTNYKFVKDIPGLTTGHIGKTQRAESGNNVNAYSYLGYIKEIKIYNQALTDQALLETTQVTAKPEKPQYDANYTNLFNAYHSASNPTGDQSANAGSNYFRIPSLLTAKDGTLIAGIDARFGGTADSANNIDIAVRTREPGQSVWGDTTLPAYFGDYSNNADILPPTYTNMTTSKSASYIDPVLVEDQTISETGRVFMLVDAFGSRGGNAAGSITPKTGSGFMSINGEKKYWELKQKGDSEYNYYFNAVDLDEDGLRTIYRKSDHTVLEGYKINANYEVVKNGAIQTVPQRAASYDGTTLNQEGYSGENVPMNILYDTSDFTVHETNYLYLFSSDDQGKTWSYPTNITGFVKPEEDTFFGVGPGVGIQVSKGDYKDRLILPVYTINPNVCSIIYSDDHGKTWTKGEDVNTGSISSMTEAQVIELPDGSLRLYARTTSGKIAYTTSLDGGETWSESKLDQSLTLTGGSGCQLSIINYSQTIDGYPALILSSPTGASRTNGAIRVGLIKETGQTGHERYEVEWAYEKPIITNNPETTTGADYFAYSCLAELPNGDIGLLYENTNARNPLEDAIRYTEYTIEELTAVERPGKKVIAELVPTEMQKIGEEVELSVQMRFNTPVVSMGEPTLILTTSGTGTSKNMDLTAVSQDHKTYEFKCRVPKVSQETYTIEYSEGATILSYAGATYTDRPASVTVSSDATNIESITLNKDQITLDEGASETLLVTINPEQALNPAVSWESSQMEVASVDQTGKVTAHQVGETTITVRSVSNPEITASATLTVQAKEPTYYTLTVDQGIQNGAIQVKEQAVAGEVVTVEVKPDKGYKLQKGSLKYNGKAFEETFVMPSETVLITAVFEESGPVLYTVGEETVGAGEEYLLGIGINSQDEAVYAQEIYVAYDPQTVEYLACEVLNNTVEVTVAHDEEQGLLHLLTVTPDGKDYLEKQLMNLKFKLKEEAKTSTKMQISGGIGIIQEGEIVTSKVETLASKGHTISITDTVLPENPLDVNQDGIIDVADLALVAYYYKEKKDNPNWEAAKCADVNGDGEVNISDLSLVAGKILEK